MADKKEEKKDLGINNDVADSEDLILDGKGLHDLYRHTTKLIK